MLNGPHLVGRHYPVLNLTRLVVVKVLGYELAHLGVVATRLAYPLVVAGVLHYQAQHGVNLVA